MVKRLVTVDDLLTGQVGLDLECADRVYLNGYVPNLQVPGQIVGLLTRHLGKPIPSPALMDQIGQRFRHAVDTFAEANHIPVVRFDKGQRKVDVMRPLMVAAAARGRLSGYYLICRVAYGLTSRVGENGRPEPNSAAGSTAMMIRYRRGRGVAGGLARLRSQPARTVARWSASRRVNNRQIVVAAGRWRMNPSRARAVSSRSCSQSVIAVYDDAPAITAQIATVRSPASG